MVLSDYDELAREVSKARIPTEGLKLIFTIDYRFFILVSKARIPTEGLKPTASTAKRAASLSLKGQNPD